MRSLCQLAEDSISINTEQFYSTNYVSSFATSATLFQSQSAALVQQFISSTTKNFLLSLRLIRNTTQANALLSTLFTNYQLVFPGDPYIRGQAVQYSNGCTCDSTSACVVQSTLYQGSSPLSPWLIPGLYSGCFVIEALFQSNLACFFDQSCLDIFHVHLQSALVMNTTALDPALHTSYSPTTTINEIVNELMVEQWKWAASHGDYYAACQPKECSYTLITRNDAIYIATAMFGLIGGLVMALKLLVPLVVDLILRKLRKKRSPEEPGAPLRLRALPRRCLRYLTNLNLFTSIPPATDPAEQRAQRISTRLFISTLSLSFAILVLYASTVRMTKIVTIYTPDLAHYNQLYEEHPQTLTCPCTKISMNYGTFLRIDHSLHQVCSSIYVTDQFISQLAIASRELATATENVTGADDFRLTGVSTFQGLRSLCQLSEDFTSINAEEFYSNNYVSIFATPTGLLQSESEALVQQFISSTTKTFLVSLRLVHNTTQANALLSALFTNFRMYAWVSNTRLSTDLMTYDGGCDCRATGLCVAQSALYLTNSSSAARWTLPGFYRGCFVLESLLKSNLVCFFDQSCLDIFQLFLQLDSRMTITALDPALTHQYSPNTTIGEIVDQLMIEQQSWGASHAAYYAACQPKECTYTFMDSNDAVYIATTVFGLLGGLVTALKLLVPIFVEFSVRQLKQDGPRAEPGAPLRLRALSRLCLRYLIDLNLFASIPPSTDPADFRAQRISTRSFLVLLGLSFTVLLLYTSTVSIVKTIMVSARDLPHYNQLDRVLQNLYAPPPQ